MGAAATCRSRRGLRVGTCGGRLVAMTLWAGGNVFRKRLYCMKCCHVASDRKD